MTSVPIAWREQLKRVLDWDEAHADFTRVTTGIPAETRGVAPSGIPYSPWQLLEHLRLALSDIYDFCVNPDYAEKEWPRDYWPPAAPPTPTAWDESVAAYKRDLDRLRALIDAQPDLLALVPNATGPHQTYLRAALLVADHSAYHLGQLVLVRRLLNAWDE